MDPLTSPSRSSHKAIRTLSANSLTQTETCAPSNWDRSQFLRCFSQRPILATGARTFCHLHSPSVQVLRLMRERATLPPQLPAAAQEQRGQLCLEVHTTLKASTATVLGHRRTSRPIRRRELPRCLEAPVSLSRGSSIPIAQRQPPYNEPMNIGFWERLLVPDQLNRRVLPSRQRADRVILARNFQYDRASPLTAQLTFRQFVGRRTPKRQHHNNGGDDAENAQRERLDCVFHGYALHSEGKARAEVLTIVLKGQPGGLFAVKPWRQERARKSLNDERYM
jgi:hypothetical protein